MNQFSDEDEIIINNEMNRIICNIDYSEEELELILNKINISKEDYLFYRNSKPLINMDIENNKKQTLRNEAYRRADKLKNKLDYILELEENVLKIMEKSK